MDVAKAGSFGRYRVIRPIGDGAMGSVFLAADDLLGREVAVKTLRPIGGSPFAAQMFQGRFTNEARAVAALSHPSIVRVFDMGFEGTVPYLVMEVVTGPSLKARLAERGPLSVAEARALGVQMARALDDAHGRGILHRDVKPANILEAAPGVWKLADFGVARLPDSELTLTGQFVGSPAYGAPEAFDRGEFTPASDVYSLAATLYEALVGQPPYGERSMLSLAGAIAREAPRPLGEVRHDLPPDLTAAIMRGLARDPAGRPAARQLGDDLASSPSSPSLPALSPVVPATPARRWPRSALLAGAMLVIGLLVGVGLATRRNGAEGASPPLPMQAAMPSAPEPEAAPEDEGPLSITPQPQSKEHAKQWNKVLDRLNRGDLGAAEHGLIEIVAVHPDDDAAQTLLRRVQRDRARSPAEED